MNATRYMLAHTDNFIKAVFAGDDHYIDSCGGMISAHGDKVEQYREYWESKGLDFEKAQIIYFLTFTKLLGDTPKYRSKEWVVDNYSKYLGFLPHVSNTSQMQLEAIIDYVVQNQDKFTPELDTSRVLYPRDFLVDNLGALENAMVEDKGEFGYLCKGLVHLVGSYLTHEDNIRKIEYTLKLLQKN